MPRPLPLLPRLLAPETLPPLPLLCVLSDILFNSIMVVKQKVSLLYTIACRWLETVRLCHWNALIPPKNITATRRVNGSKSNSLNVQYCGPE
ncbi:unnamed protein product [Staurois parvus]|uniref:Secreted protein n=1 Tax=Staurois parvus TaxID=386267 RepID=A0ABN9G2F5_9NEOB|nr:unnamed protein product [Staurois parvus]